MNKAAELEVVIIQALRRRFNLPEDLLRPDADLLMDCGLDSMQLVQLLVDLEIEQGVQVPEAALAKGDFSTVTALAGVIAEHQPRSLAPPAGAGEPELDIKVHCFVSCLCEPLKKIPGIDHRPFYFGVWDAEVFVDSRFRLSYHAENVDHSFFTHWYERLYGVAVVPWYDRRLGETANLENLQQLLEKRAPHEWLMVMLDLYQLPERENKFNKNPFPHYVMLENLPDPLQIWMWDPDFRWQGALVKQRVLQAIAQPTVAGGYRFSTAVVKAPERRAVDAYFAACFKGGNNPMTDTVREILEAHTQAAEGIALADLGEALRELPVLAIRKYAYEHGLAFFWRELDLPAEAFEGWCCVIEQLVKGYDQVQFQAMKFAGQPAPAQRKALENLLLEQNAREFRIKAELRRVHRLWQREYGLADSGLLEVVI